MKIDWKEFSKSEGYQKLKQTVIKSILRCRISKYKNKPICFNIMGCKSKEKQCYNNNCSHFKWIIDKTKHFSLKYKISPGNILTIWENNRRYSWENYYQNCQISYLERSISKAVNFNVK
jgi:hypothetical protein